MSLTFTETLRGSYFLLESPETTRLCEVAVHMRVSRPRELVHAFDAELTGQATFDGLLEQAEITGQVHVELRRPRSVTYDFSVVAADGRVLRFQGSKHPSLLRPLYSATTLWGTLQDGDQALAMVRLHFDLRRDLAVFLQSLSREQDQ